MESFKAKLLIITSVLLCATSLGTCHFGKNKTGGSETLALSGADYLHQLKKERQELQAKYESVVAQLKLQQDSMKAEVKESKRQLIFSQRKAKVLQHDLVELFNKGDSSGLINADTARVMAQHYFNAESEKDSLCNETVQKLQDVISVQDSFMIVHETLEASLKAGQKEQELRTKNLTEQLNQFHKDLRKKSRQNILLKTGLSVLSGVAGSLLIIQALK